MLNSLLLDIVMYLTTQGVVTGDGIDTFRDFTPDMPDNVITVSEYTGSPTVFYEPTVHRSIQVACRNSDADNARSQALLLYRQFQSDNLIINFTPDRWGQVSLRQTPFKLSVDTKGRTTYGFNMGITTTIE